MNTRSRIRAVAKLVAAQLTVGDDGERCWLQDPVHSTLRLAIASHEISPGQLQHLRHGGFRNLGEMVANHHQGHRLGHVGRRHPQQVGVLELAKHFQLVLGVGRLAGACRYVGQARAEVEYQGGAVERGVQAARIEQFIEQQRVPTDLAGDPGTCVA